MKNMDKEAECVSCLMDGETGDDAVALHALMQDPEMRRRWSNYHLISEVMKNQLSGSLDTGFAARVSAALEAEPVVFAPKALATAHKPLKKHLAGWAVAASVAVAAVVGVQLMLQQQSNPSVPLAANTLASPPPQPVMTAQNDENVSRVDYVQQVDDPMINQYVVNHNEYASGINGMLPYARIVVSRRQ